MSNFPSALDDDSTIPAISDNLSEIGEETVNALRDAVFNIETEIGTDSGSGSAGSISTRLNVSLEADGSIKASALTSLGLVVLPITNSQISATAQIIESKLSLDHATDDLYNLILNQNSNINTALMFVNGSGSKIEPHLLGTSYRHILSEIDISTSTSDYLKDKSNLTRDNTNLYTLLSDINTDLITHEKSNSTAVGQVPPTNYGHVASGIYLTSSAFSFIPQSITDLQQFAQFIDNSNIFLLGSKTQTLFANGIPRSSRAASLIKNTNGQSIITSTTAITYLLNSGASAPVDDIDNGDDIVEFTPSASDITNSVFDAKFSNIKIGDILTVNYGDFTLSSVIKEKKLLIVGPDKRYIVRIEHNNIAAGTYTATIDKPLFTNNKAGALALGQANAPTNVLPSLIIGSPRGAQVVGIDFNYEQIDSSHYNLWLQFYPTGNPTSSVVNMAAIDISGNQGTTPGKYTLASIVEAANNAFRTAGFNYRFIAFSNNGEFGIMIADSYNNSSFSVISGIVASDGSYDTGLSHTIYANNVIGLAGFDNFDALGFGINKANVASPPYATTFANTNVAQVPTKLFVPLTTQNYLVNGTERDRFSIQPGQITDGYGDGYWFATITAKTIVPGTRVEVTYKILDNLSDVKIAAGQTLVVQPISSDGTIADFGRFFIKDVQFNNCPGPSAYTNITVYDAIHSTGSTPFASAAIGATVGIYFTADSVGFNQENASDFSETSDTFKRFFEIYTNQDGYSFSHERARLDLSGSTSTINSVQIYSDSNLTGINLYNVSSKLRGYEFSSVNKINLQVESFDQASGIFTGFLCNFDGVTVSNQGPTTNGKKGEIVRFYDESNIDFIDFIFALDASIPQINSTKNIDIQLFPTLSLDEELMQLGTCQIDTSIKEIQYLRDTRQFGNISEKQLSNSAQDFISAPIQLLNENGIINGLDITSSLSGDGYNIFHIDGGTALVNGKIINVNDTYITIPIVEETLYPAFTTNITTIKWFICLNDKGKYELVASTDFDPNGSDAASYNGLTLDHTRIFYVNNPNNTGISAYPIKGTYFSDLVLNYKYLTPVAIVTTDVTLSTNYILNTNVIFEDARRFIANGYSGMKYPLTFGSQANFRTFTALNTWLTNLNKFNSFSINTQNSFGDTVLVKDAIDITNLTFDFGNTVKFIGDGGKFYSTDATTMEEIILENLKIEISSTGISFNGTTNRINQCFVNYLGIAGGSVYPIKINTSSRAVITNTIFKRNGVSIGAFINNLGALTVIASNNVHEGGTLITGTSSAATNASDG